MTEPGAVARQALASLLRGQDLRQEMAERLFSDLMEGRLSEAMAAGLLVGLAVKGESAGEIAGAAATLRKHLVPIHTRRHNLVDTCGTGGDGKGTFNISTAAAIVAAAAGVAVAKHGNRSVSSRSGSADVLEALGVEIEVDADRAGRALDDIGLTFLFAPRLHPAMRRVMPVRQALGVRTIFNILGPLSNPAGAKRQVLGVFEDRLVPLLADVLIELGCEHALVVRGSDGLDELTTTSQSLVAEVRDRRVETYRVDPRDLGLPLASAGDLLGGDPSHNAELCLQVLGGRQGPLLDITALNAGAAIYVGGGSPDLASGLGKARETIESGAALEKLTELIEFDAGSRDG